MTLPLFRWLLIPAAFIGLPLLQAHAQSETKTDCSHEVDLPAGETPIELFNLKALTGWKGFE